MGSRSRSDGLSIRRRFPTRPTNGRRALGFAWDVTGDGRTVVRGHTGLYYARTPGLLLASPMNNFRIPAGDLSIQLPYPVPAGNPNNTLYRQLLLIGIDLNRFALEQPADSVHRADDTDRLGARARRESLRRGPAAGDGSGLQEPARDPGRLRRRTRAVHRNDARRRLPLRARPTSCSATAKSTSVSRRRAPTPRSGRPSPRSAR